LRPKAFSRLVDSVDLVARAALPAAPPPHPREQRGASRATLRFHFSLGAGVTPAARRAGDYSSPLS
jgi:hypothetical protein